MRCYNANILLLHMKNAHYLHEKQPKLIHYKKELLQSNQNHYHNPFTLLCNFGWNTVAHQRCTVSQYSNCVEKMNLTTLSIIIPISNYHNIKLQKPNYQHHHNIPSLHQISHQLNSFISSLQHRITGKIGHFIVHSILDKCIFETLPYHNRNTILSPPLTHNNHIIKISHNSPSFTSFQSHNEHNVIFHP